MIQKNLKMKKYFEKFEATSGIKIEFAVWGEKVFRPTEDEEMTVKEGTNHSSKDPIVKGEGTSGTRNTEKRTCDSHSSESLLP